MAEANPSGVGAVYLAELDAPDVPVALELLHQVPENLWEIGLRAKPHVVHVGVHHPALLFCLCVEIVVELKDLARLPCGRGAPVKETPGPRGHTHKAEIVSTCEDGERDADIPSCIIGPMNSAGTENPTTPTSLTEVDCIVRPEVLRNGLFEEARPQRQPCAHAT